MLPDFYSYFFFFLMILRPPRSTPFPTRRSSDLGANRRGQRERATVANADVHVVDALSKRAIQSHRRQQHRRSEEHTSELQSLTNLVCRLLLEKKKKKKIQLIKNNKDKAKT